jgi:4-alpha-glucanotransferase
LGKEARAFADWLKAAGQRWWQMLPVTPLGAGFSPYSSDSAFAGNAWLVDLEDLAGQGLLTRAELRPARKLPEGRANYAASIGFREARLRQAFERFGDRNGRARDGFDEFCDRERAWLADYALYCALKRLNGGTSWSQWEKELRARQPAALAEARARLRREVDYHQFAQYQFDRQWQAFRAYCNGRGVGLIGDVPIFVAYDSADVWANQDLFVLDRQGRPKVVTGVPPDMFSADGQRWGHPQYDWAAHRRQGYRWWLGRMGSMFDHFDAVRIDHFIGFHRSWWIGAHSGTAKNGRWVPGAGEDFFAAVQRTFGQGAQIIAEDLGELTEGAIRLRDQFGLPGMRVMQFGFEGGDYYLPHVYPVRSVGYTGTHDNNTTVGWYEDLKRRARKDKEARAAVEKMRAYVGACGEKDVHRAMMRTLYLSQSQTAIVPAQDLLGLGENARMNTPGTSDGNWLWRLRPGEMSGELAERVRRMTDLYGRA